LAIRSDFSDRIQRIWYNNDERSFEKGKIMRKFLTLLTLFFIFFLFVISCLTINIYFPEAAVQKTAEEIVDDVRESEEGSKKKIEKDVSQASFSLIPVAYAQQEETVSTPRIRALKQSLREKESLLLPFFQKGNIGEGNDGFVQIRSENGLSLKEKADLRRVTKDVNSDREDLYREVAKALNIDQSQTPRIQKIFAKKWIENSRPGWWIQREEGEWIRKK
jgi:uncharacterized protein YdbL (DUF1318 family)